MGRYLNEARQHWDIIEHYYKHAGPAGYSQTQHHYNRLSEYYQKSAGKRNHAGDAPAIKGMYEEAGKLLEEMKRREEGLPDHEG